MTNYKLNHLIWILMFLPMLGDQPCVAQQLYHDSVTIVQLDETLYARSRLGGMCVDRLGYLYVSNFYDAVWKISRNGDVTLLTDGLYGSSGNTVDKNGNLYQAGFFDHSIVKIDRFSNVTPYVSDGLNGPVGMVFDEENNLFVCNYHENNILKISPDKTITVYAHGEMFNGPNGITIDDGGDVYVANFNTNQIIKIDDQGIPSVFTTIPGPDGNAHLVFHKDMIYVTKIKSNQVFRVNREGDFKLVGGTGQPIITEGQAVAASFSAPNGIAVDPFSDEIFVNNVKGKWTSGEMTSIELSRIKVVTIAQLMKNYINAGDIDGAKAAFWKYHNDPFHANENIGPPVGALGWQYMAQQNVTASLALFALINEAYPDRWRPYFYLGEVYKIIGQPDNAMPFYQNALELNPNNKTIQSRLNELQKK